MIDDRPVLIFTFNTQQITVIRDKDGKIAQGSEVTLESTANQRKEKKPKETNRKG